MNMLDRAKKQLENRFKGVGEETIRVMDAVKEEPQAKEKKPKPAPKPPVKKETKTKDDNEKFNFKNKIFSRPVETSDKKAEEEPKQIRQKVQKQPVETPPVEESAFSYDDEDVEEEYFEKMDKKHKEKMKAYEKVPVPLVDNGKVQDILKILQIPPTFEIDSDIFLPEDLKDIAFDLQVPQGYETSEVDTFVSRVIITITKYVELLKLRNENVAQLATVIDRLQVDISNMRLDSEVANGINIMPTNDTEHLEQENLELKSLVKRQEEQIKAGYVGVDDTLTSKEREIFEQLQDEVSLKDREIENLKEQLYLVKNQLSSLQEEQDEYFPQEDSAALPEFNNDSFDDELPDEIGLPDIGNDLFDQSETVYSSTSNSAFEDDDEPLEDFLFRNQSNYEFSEDNESSIDLLDDNGKTYQSPYVGTYFDDDEEDELDKLQEWGHNR